MHRLPLYLLAYKITCLLTGVACIYMGYRLFSAGVFAPATLEAAKGHISFTLQNAAPGTFFALFGTFVIGFTVFRGLRLDSQKDEQYRKTFTENADVADDILHSIAGKIQTLLRDGRISLDDGLMIHTHLLEIASCLRDMTPPGLIRQSNKERFQGFAAPE
jgi:hypothetical protein